MTKKEKGKILQTCNDQMEVAHKAREPYITKTIKHRKQFAGILTQRTDSRQKKLTTVNVNRTRTAVKGAVRGSVKAFLRGERLLKVKPRGPDDYDTAEIIDQHMAQTFSDIPGIEELMYKHFMQTYTVGTGPTKLRYDKYRHRMFFDWILFENCWLEPAAALALVTYIVECVPTRKRDLNWLADRGEYDPKVVKKFLANTTGKAKDARTTSLSEEKKELPDEYGKDFYDVGLFWQEKDLDPDGNPIWEVATVAGEVHSGKFEALDVLTPAKTPYWCGHPYSFGTAYFHPLSVYGTGIPEEIRELQRIRNMISVQKIDYINRILQPPTLVESNVFVTTEDAQAFINPELGKMSVVKPGTAERGIRQFDMPAISPAVFMAEQELDAIMEQQTGLPDLLTGAQPARREPGVTTRARMGLAAEGIEEQVWIMATTFYKPMLKKYLVCLQQYWNEKQKKDFIEITGIPGIEWLKLGDGRMGADTRIVDESTFRFGASKKEALKHYDIKLVPIYEAEAKEMVKQNLAQLISAIPNFVEISPEVRENIDFAALFREIVKVTFPASPDKIFGKPRRLPPKLSYLLNQALMSDPQRFMRVMEEARLIPTKEQTEEGKGGQGVKGNVPAPGVPEDAYQRPSPEIAAASDIERSESAGMA